MKDQGRKDKLPKNGYISYEKDTITMYSLIKIVQMGEYNNPIKSIKI
jgi:hypothetical protein